MHLPMDQNFIDNGPALLNTSLPEDIHVFAVRRVVTSDEYRISPKRIEELNELLGCYVGSHNFFNYTSGLEFSDQTARRVILSITAEEPFLYTDPVRLKPVEFLRIKIRGQSFILHQIRKMIGTVLAIMRGFMYKSDVARSFLSRKPKKVKYAMLLAYQGQNYFGMQFQRNPKFPTIENHLFNAMEAHGFITKEHYVNLMDWHFQRAARTDRSVSAVGQVCSMHLPMDQNFIDNGPALLNTSLPEDIHVFAVRRVTPSFHAQKSCDSRTYSYTLPTFSFASMDEVTSDEYRISPKRIEELNELLGCYVGSHNFFNYTSGLLPMGSTVLAIMRGFMYKSDVARSFLSVRMDIPKAPGLGLLLERLHYDRFEKRFEKTHGSLNNWGEEIETQLLEWRDKMIMDRILSEECRTQSMMRWLTTLPAHNYITDPEDETGDKSINKDLSVGSDPSNIADNEGDELEEVTELDNNDDLETEPSQFDEENEKNFENETEGEKVDRSKKSVAI
uniref:Pseudouridine synthase I TruA alpha/beta domain-containing protein n=1 Tax=Meloidogyne floridensis TaxID=298350 RepID=A0A915NLL9_9BILA